jgi:hypothetical protein
VFLEPLADHIRLLVISFVTDGEVVKKHHPEPKIKPKRRRPSFKNKTDRSDHSQKVMQEYRENGKDYQKKPDKVKEYRRKKKKEFLDKVL